MATIQTSGIITSIKGSIAGTTFQRSGSGLTARKKPIPLKAKTNQQTTVRILQSRLNAEWLNLTDSQRQTWQSYAVFCNGSGLTNKGNRSANTGKMQFLAVNFWLLLYGKDLLVTPGFANPLTPFIPCPPLFNESDNLMNYTGSLDTSRQILVTRVSSPQSLATVSNNTGFRTLVYNQIDGDVQNWADAYLATYGISLIENKKYWIELQVVDFITGAISSAARKLVKYVSPDISFKLVFNTSLAGSPSNQVVIPCQNVGVFNADIDWGDGSTSHVSAYNDANLAHVYASPGIYVVSITGTFPNIYFNNSGDRLKLIDISQFGAWRPQTLQNAFYGCSNLTGSFSDAPDMTLCSNMSQAFRGCSSFNGDLSNLNVQTVTSLFRTFEGCTVFNADISGWDVSIVTSCLNTFLSCTNFNADLSGWNTASVTSTNGMFFGCTSFNRDLSTWNVANVTMFQSMFQNATLVNFSLAAWNVSNALSMSSFMSGAGLSTANLDATYNEWSLLTLKPNVACSFGATKYTIATSGAARAIIVGAPNNWILTDGGGI